MKTLVLYDSQFGNTEILARTIAAKLGGSGPVEIAAATAGLPDLHGVDLLVVGCPTQIHGLSPAMRMLLAQFAPGALDGILAAAFDTRMPGAKIFTGAASGGIAQQLKRHGARLLLPAESFLVTGREGPLADGEVERATTWAGTVYALAREYLPEPVGAAR